MRRTRRDVLTGLAAATGALAGCGGVVGGTRDPVEILAAASLQVPLEEGLRPATSTPVAIEPRGSASAARLVANGDRDPDVLVLADTTLFESPLGDVWYASFATNHLVVATADTPAGRRVRRADPWFQPVLDGEARLGRTDPDLDPLGYRTLFMLALAGRRYDRPGLPGALTGPEQVYPETALASTLSSGAVDAAVLYGNMATNHGFATVDLAPAVDLGSPDRVQTYRTTSYDLPGGPTVTGDLIAYGATLRRRTRRTRPVFERLVAGDYLDASGLEVPAAYPRFTEDAPAAVA